MTSRRPAGPGHSLSRGNTDPNMPPREFVVPQPSEFGTPQDVRYFAEYQAQHNPSNFSDPGPIGVPASGVVAPPGGSAERGRSRRASDTRQITIQRDRQGWDFEFQPKPDSKYECPICLFVLRDPIQTMCGHRFCCECIQQWLRTPPEVHCPVCNDVISDSALFPDKFANREILGFTIRCPRSRDGCTQIIALKELNEHLRTACQFELVDCPNRCGACVLRKDVTAHCERECEHRMVVCSACKQRVPHQDNMEHNKKCPEQQQNCDYCNQLFLRKLIAEHKRSECEEAPVQCSFHAVGCSAPLTHKTMDEHYTDSMQHHLELVMQKMHELLADSNMQSSHTTIRPSSSQLSRYDEKQGKALKIGYGASSRQGAPGSWDELGPSYVRGVSVAQMDASLGQSCAAAAGADAADGDSSVKPSLLLDLDEKRRHQDGQLARHEQQLLALTAKVDSLEKKQREQSAALAHKDELLAALESRLSNGIFYWRIKDFSAARQEAKDGVVTVRHSDGFYTSCHGYKLCIRANLNGVDGGNGSHVSLFIHFMRGDFDDILDWPFKGRITMTIVDQGEHRQHIVEVLESKPNLAAFQRPHSNRNHKGFGYIEFAPIGLIENSTYVKNDTLIIKAEVTEL